MVPISDEKDVATLPNDEKKTEEKPKKIWRNLIAYWLLGLCNNYGYVVMLTAANDILEDDDDDSSDTLSAMFSNHTRLDTVDKADRDCNMMSTGAVLLADIIPALLIKLVAPFLPFFVHVRVAICVALASAGFLVVAFSTDTWMAIMGVAITSLSSGLGEVTFLQYSSFYDKDVVSTWSSGTGGAGVAGALSYAVLNSLGFETTLLIMLIVPFTMAVSFWGILKRPEERPDLTIQVAINEEEITQPVASFKNKLRKVPGLLKYMIPLGMVYLFEYFINQGMFELINFDDFFINHDDQYRWLQVDYQIGVFISRSSVNIVHIKHIWVMSVLQLVNVIIFTTEAIYYYMPSFWIILVLTLWEGMLGGGAYVNTFYKISSEVPEEERQFSMGVTSFADSTGITLAGIFAMLAHNAICDTDKPTR